MANRITQEFNNILNDSEFVSDFYSKRYLSKRDIKSGTLSNSQVFTTANIDMYYRIRGYELFEEKEQNFNSISNVAGNILGTAGALNIPMTFSVYNNGELISVFYGTKHTHAEQMKSSLKVNMFSASINNEWINSKELSAIQTYNGFIAGVSKIAPGTIDMIINSLQHKAFLINIVTLPISQDVIATELYKINEYLDSFQRVSRTEMTIGSNRNRNYYNDNHHILELIETLNKEKKRLQRGQVNGLWHVAFHVSAADRSTYKEAAAVIAAAFRSNSSSEDDNAVSLAFDTDFPIVKSSVWSLPTAFLGSKNLGGIYSQTLLNIAELDIASSLLTLPLYPHAGYFVNHLGQSSISTGAFDLYPSAHPSSDGVFNFGKLDNNLEYEAALDSFRQHAFVTGTTRYGKTTSVKRILSEAQRNGISFIVIEAVKKEYWELLGCENLSSMKVYSAGMDARELRINPFEPEENTILDFHIQSIIQAFMTLFDGTDPIPQIITALVYLCYEKKGWDASKRVRKDVELEYPILSDMLLYLDECIDSIGYGEEVRNNMRGVIQIRISSLIRQAGQSLNTRENTSIREMYSSSAVIELDDFSDRNKPFAASLIAIKANEFSRQCKMENKLRRLLVIEEAHHILPNSEMKSVSQNAAECSKYFSNILAEVSAYGTGVIIVDQRPSKISSAALANTGIKIIHNIREGEDINTIARSLSLKDYEAFLLNKLDVGQAIITIPQISEVCKVRIDGKLKKNTETNLACLFCDQCSLIELNQITQFEKNYISSNGYNHQSITACIQAMESKSLKPLEHTAKICLAGKLAELSKENDLIKRQHLYEYIKSINKIGR
jgi:hypothetical protein